MDTKTLLYSLILTLAGVVIGWLLQVITTEIRERREIQRAVSSAAASCLARLKKMQIAREYSKAQIFQDEKYHLGADSDDLLQALSRRSKIMNDELGIYEDIGELLVEVPEEDKIDEHISQLIQGLQKMIIFAA
jgi:chaperonin cofactor prefoldin